MDKEIVSLKLGAEGQLIVSLKGGNVVVEVKYDGADLGADVSVVIKSRSGLEKLKKMIPGTLDDMVIGLIEQAIGA